MTRIVPAAIAAILLALSLSALAQQEPNKQAARERELLRRAQAAQKQAEEAKAAAEQEKAKVEAEAKAAKAQIAKTSGAVARERKRGDELQATLDTVTRERASLASEKETLAGKLAQAEARLNETLRDLAGVRDALAASEKELAQVRKVSALQAKSIRVCEDKNLKLYGVTTEVMARYKDQGFWDAVKRKEPFTGLRQVEVENLLEEYRDRAAEARVEVPCRQ